MQRVEKMAKKPKLSYSEYQERYAGKNKRNKTKRGGNDFYME